ncbi:peptide chain release factor N(5)-glutamine methyltransferase [Marinilactibacillus sp. 15R]|uniref:peptide chain release factor N(5)-glutamine methyltransferase n=1 Tax=Marinilactibacillus sp. 15R TaxID=1911586 RepID=UPI001E4A2CC8|nr:peptide chain release factor N(5)-glutamine methyltransferase [Marinilactibacillus sp. 15R]
MSTKMKFEELYEKETFREVLAGASSFLKSRGKEGFAAEWLLRERNDLSKTQLIRRYSEPMSKAVKEMFLSDVQSFIEGLPLQYIIGHEWFYDRKFNVSSNTLIPRPETEEWFDRYIKKLPNQPFKVLDIGTGSGVLAISHKLERQDDQVVAVDISSDALEIAEDNAATLGADVEFYKSDLTQAVKDQSFDLIISNPPYISINEKSVMDQSVLDHEPSIALFAREDGLEIYRRLAEELPLLLKPKGKIILEIGYLQGESVYNLFEKAFPEAEIDIWQDMAGQDRVVFVMT